MNLISYTDLPSTFNYHKIIDELKLDISRLELELDMLSSNMDVTFKKLYEENKQYVDTKIELEHEIIRLGNLIKSMENDKLLNMVDSFKEKSNNNEMSDLRENMDKKSLCKKLFHKISYLTHPDITKDEDLNSIFIKSKSAYKHMDLNSLREIYTNVTKNNLNKIMDSDVEVSYLQYEINDLNDKKNKLMNELTNIKNSENYNIYMNYNHTNIINKLTSKNRYINNMTQIIVHLNTQKMILGKKYSTLLNSRVKKV